MNRLIPLLLFAIAGLAAAQSVPPGGGKPLLASDDAGSTLHQVRRLYFPSGTLGCTGATCTYAGGGSAVAPYSLAFSASTTETVTAATHGQGTTPMDGGCYTSAGVRQYPDTWTRNGSGDVTITFPTGAAFTGTCGIFSGSGGGGGSDYTLPTASAETLGGVKVGAGLTITDGVLAASGGGSTYTAGAGVDITDGVISAATATVPTFLTATASLTFETFGGTGNCEEQNITVAGAAAGDAVTLGLPQTFPAGVVQGAAWVSTANTVTVRLCRLAGSGTISAQTFRAWINKTF